MNPTRRPARLAAVAASALLLTLTLTGCGVLENIFPAQAQRNAETQEIEESGQQDVFQVSVGDCFNEADASTTEVSDIPAVPCDTPHDYEVFHLFDLTGDTFPTDLDDQSIAGCGEQFQAFVGIDYDSSVLDYTFIQPTAGSWESGDREVICSIFEPDVKSTGTLAGAAR